MKFFKKHYKKIIILACDCLLPPIALLCKHLSQRMLSVPSTCLATVFGGKCLGCGGTHFVKNFLSGNFIDAFFDHQFLFICAIYLFVSLIVLNLFMLFDLKIAKKILLILYSIPSLICFLAGMFWFVIIRNIPAVIRLVGLVWESAQTIL